MERLESLSGVERETTIRKLLGLEKLIIMAERFKILPADEWLLKEYAERLRLAETQARIPQLRERLTSLSANLDAITVSQILGEIEEQEADIAEQEQSLKQMQVRRLDLKNHLGRAQQLKKADVTLGEIISSYEYMAEARRELPELEKQVAELERREREDLPALEKRVNELSELTRSFGTLQRMSSDLLSAVDTIKELEQELKQHNEILDDLKSLDEQIAHARAQLTRAQQDLQDLDDQQRTGRPQREAHLQNLQALAQRLQALLQLEDQYTRRLASKEQAAESTIQLQKVQKDLDETEHELQLAKTEDQQAQQQAETLEMRWRQLAVRRQMEEWQHLKEVSQGLALAEQHVRQAYQQQEKLNSSAMEAHNTARRYIVLLVSGIGLFLVCLILAAVESLQRGFILATIFGIVAIVMAALAGFSLQNFGKAREEKFITDKQLQDATSRVGMMVAAREAAIRTGGSQEGIVQVEHEIRSLGGNVPHSIEEAQLILQRTEDHGESLADIQQRMKEKLDAANATRNQVNVTIEAAATLRKERARLEELRTREGWDDIEGHLREDLAAVEHIHQEIIQLAAQEGLPLPECQ